MAEIKCIRQEQDFSDLRTTWNELLARSDSNTPFLTHQWLHSWWEAFGRGAELHLLLFYETIAGISELIGIFPGFIRKTGIFPPLRALRLLGNEVVDSDFLDIIIASGKENQVYPALWGYLRESSAFQLTDLTDILDSSPTAKLILEGKAGRLRVTNWQAMKICPYIDLPESPEAYFACLSPNTRKRYRYRRQLEARGAQLEIIREESDFSDAMKDFTRLHTERRQQKGQPGVFATDGQRAFYESAFRSFLKAGWLELVFLKIGSERVAGVCQFNYGESIYYYQAGYDTAWEQSRVGFVLLCMLLEKAIQEKKRYYEFLRGKERYKYAFGVTGERRLVDLTLNDDGIRGNFAIKGRKYRSKIRSCIKSVLPDNIVEMIRKR